MDIEGAARRIEGVVERTALVPFPSGDERVELRLKLECLQATGSFKARGAWNQVSQLSPEQRSKGVVTVSSGNHGKALSWAAASLLGQSNIAVTEFYMERATLDDVFRQIADHGPEN